MTRRQAWQSALLLGLVALPLSVRGLHVTSYAGWPAIGFAVALLVRAGRRHVLAASAAIVLVGGAAVTYSYRLSPWAGLLGGLALALPALLTWHLVTRGGTRPLRLDTRTTGSYHAATAASALLCGAIALGGGYLALPHRQAVLGAVMSAASSLTAQLVVLPLLSPRTPRPAVARRYERWAQRVTLTVVMAGVFVPRTELSLVFLVLPVLAWAATRMTARETHVQVFCLSVAAYALTFAGNGPIANAPSGLPARLTPLLLYVFLAACCYLTVPVVVMVDLLSTTSTRAHRAATTVQRLLDSATGTIFIATDAAGRITHYNGGAERMLGWSAAEVVGRSPAMFHEDGEIRRQAEHFAVEPTHAAVALAQAESDESRDWAFRRRDGGIRMVSLMLTPFTDDEGTVIGYIGAGEDITERLRAEEALRTALEKEYDAADRLREVDHVKQELVSNVSHELRTPITSIAGYAELLSDGLVGELSEPQLDAVARIERNTERLELLVEDLLTLSRAESGELELERSPTDLRDVAREAHDVLSEVVRHRTLTVELDLPEHPVTVSADPRALERVAVNLLGNAVKFTPDGGRVVLSVRSKPRGAELSVEDTGVGISPEDQAQLFTRFFRAAAANADAVPGTGLGLSIVHAIVTQHGGEVVVRSSLGHGTVMTVKLPDVAGPATGRPAPRAARIAG